MDTANAVTDTIMSQIGNTQMDTNWWMIIAFIEFFLIIFLLINQKRGKENDAKKLAKQRVLNEGEIDFKNAITSSFHAQELYKTLITKCHPDRFAPDVHKMEIANEISTQITEHQNSYKELVLLKEKAIEKLNINI
ncbi:MAG: hypothetical protein MJZ45_02805 [Bacteroidales bacterium]|nr:hypothetical protein [Bacteroidales bacterium]